MDIFKGDNHPRKKKRKRDGMAKNKENSHPKNPDDKKKGPRL